MMDFDPSIVLFITNVYMLNKPYGYPMTTDLENNYVKNIYMQ